MNKETILGFVRHILTFAGGLGVSEGIITADELTTAVSAVITLAGVIWSAIDKRSA